MPSGFNLFDELFLFASVQLLIRRPVKALRLKPHMAAQKAHEIRSLFMQSMDEPGIIRTGFSKIRERKPQLPKAVSEILMFRKQKPNHRLKPGHMSPQKRKQYSFLLSHMGFDLPSKIKDELSNFADIFFQVL